MVNAPLDHLKFFHAPWLELAVKPGQMLLERNWMGRKIDEDVAIPHRRGNCVQRIIGFTEALHLFHVRRIGQSSVKLISPCVILALNASCKFSLLLLAQHGAAMPADIVES